MNRGGLTHRGHGDEAVPGHLHNEREPDRVPEAQCYQVIATFLKRSPPTTSPRVAPRKIAHHPSGKPGQGPAFPTKRQKRQRDFPLVPRITKSTPWRPGRGKKGCPCRLLYPLRSIFGGQCTRKLTVHVQLLIISKSHLTLSSAFNLFQFGIRVM